eukprot:4543102-Pyramimonas_sp.AAC.1
MVVQRLARDWRRGLRFSAWARGCPRFAGGPRWPRLHCLAVQGLFGGVGTKETKGSELSFPLLANASDCHRQT